jgi:hypothetical protein
MTTHTTTNQLRAEEHAARLAARETSRLTSSDIETMAVRVRETLRHWIRNSADGRFSAYSCTDHETLERVAHNAIGCRIYDLRDSELAQVTSLVAIIAADLLAGASDFACWKLQH